MRYRQNELGMSLAEVMVALAVVGIMIFTSMVVTTQSHMMTRANTDKEFATQKAISMIEEMKALIQVNNNGNITTLDTYDDGVNNNPILTIQGTNLQTGDPTTPTQPGDAISGNTPFSPTLWTYERHITVTIPFGLGTVRNDVRLVDVKMYKNTAKGKQLLSEVSSVIRSIISNFSPSQVYDVYIVAIENVPGWWVYMSNVEAVVRDALSNLEGRNPGLVFRERWIQTLAYGRDQQYKPYINDASTDSSGNNVDNFSTNNIPWVYFYPGQMPDTTVIANTDTGNSPPVYTVGNAYYYYPAFFRGHIMVNTTDTNGYDATPNTGAGATGQVNPYPYALADQYNHAMRYPDELALYNQRYQNNNSEQMTLRLLLEDMYSSPDKYTNALVINLHGELLPFPPIRNYSDAAKDPESVPPAAPVSLQNVRVVTHPEQLAYSTSTAAGAAATVNLRVYSYLTNPDAAGALRTLPTATPISILIHGTGTPTSGTPTAGWTPAPADIDNIAGPWLGSANGLSGGATTPVYSYNTSTPLCASPAPGDGTMCYTTQLVGSPAVDTLIKLYNSPVRSPIDTSTGMGLDYGSRLYNMEYIPSPVEDLTVAAPLAPFTNNLSSISPLPKNTARWVIQIPAADVPANGMVTVETRIGDVCNGTFTPVCSGAISNTTNVGTLYPVRNHPANLSRTFVWRGTDVWLYGDATTTPITRPNLPITERYQFQGDPRHCPYADLKKPFLGTTATAANESPLGMGYNRYFDNFEDASYNGATYTQMIGSQAGTGASFNFSLTATTNKVALKINGGSTTTVTLGGTPPNVRSAAQIVSDLNTGFSGKAVADIVNGHIRIMPKVQPQSVQFDTTAGTAQGVLGFDNVIRTAGAWVGWSYTTGGVQYGVKNSGALDVANAGAAGWSTSGNGDLEIDVSRLHQITRSALIRSNAIWTTMTGWSYYYVGIGNEIGYDSANGFQYSIPVSTMPFTGASGGWSYIDSITKDTNTGGTGSVKQTTSQGTYLVRLGGALPVAWWAMPWLGELYPDSAYQNTVAPGTGDWLNNGNLPSNSTTNPAYFVRDLRQNYFTFPGTDLEQTVRRTWQNGCVDMFWAGSAASSFRHTGVADTDTGTIQTAGTDIANRYAYPVPNTINSNRPFDVAAAAGATPDNFLQNAYMQSDVSGMSTGAVTKLKLTASNRAAVLNPYYNLTQTGSLPYSSALLTLNDPVSYNTAFIAVNGLSPTGITGTSFISNWAFLTLVQSYFNGGLYTDTSPSPKAHHIRQMPQVVITSPSVTTNLKNPNPLVVTWATSWLRWDGQTYSTAYPAGYSETNSAGQPLGLTYQVMYSPSNGAPDPNAANNNPTGWRFIQTGNPATLGVKSSNAAELINSSTSPTSINWDVSDTTKFPAANYLIRVEAYRQGYPLNYSFHEYRAYISR